MLFLRLLNFHLDYHLKIPTLASEINFRGELHPVLVFKGKSYRRIECGKEKIVPTLLSEFPLRG